MPSINDKILLNFRDIRKRLEDLPKKVVSKVVRRAVYAGAVVVRDAARSKVPVDTGALKSSIVAKANKKKGGEISASIGVQRKTLVRGKKAGKSPRRYAHLVEFGSPHVAPRPFLRPAIDTQVDAVIEAVRKKMIEGIDGQTKAVGGSASTSTAAASSSVADAVSTMTTAAGETIATFADGTKKALVRAHTRSDGKKIAEYWRKVT